MDYVSEENLALLFRALAHDKSPLEFFRDVEGLDRRQHLTGTDRSLATYILKKIGVARKDLTEEHLAEYLRSIPAVRME